VGDSTIVDAATEFDRYWSPGIALAPGEYKIVATQVNRVTNYDTRPFVVPCPTITVTPACVPSGGPPDTFSLTVSGSGWEPLNSRGEGKPELSVVVDPGDEPQEFFSHYTAPRDDGSFGPVEITPYARPNGTYVVRVVQTYYDNVIERQAEMTVGVPCRRASLSVDPACGPPAILGDVERSYDLTLTFSNFPALSFVVTVDADGVAGPDYPPETIAFLGDTIPTQVTVQARYRPPGVYRILVSGSTAVRTVEASATFTVPCETPAPTLDIDPPCGQEAAGQPAAYTVAVTGSGFAFGHVDLLFDPLTMPPEGAIADADETGGFATSMQLNGRPAGSYQLVASQSTALGLLDEVGATFVVPCAGRTLTITPTSGPLGFVPLVEGFGFPVNTRVLLRWDHGIGATRPISVDTDDSGGFDKQVLIFAHDFMGLRHLTVELPDDPAAFSGIEAAYLVTAGFVAPPFFVDNPFGPPDEMIVRH
jgi:hypothetical protein